MSSDLQISGQPKPSAPGAPSLLPVRTTDKDFLALQIQLEGIKADEREQKSPRLQGRTSLRSSGDDATPTFTPRAGDLAQLGPDDADSPREVDASNYWLEDSDGSLPATPVKTPSKKEPETPSPIKDLRQILQEESPDFDLTSAQEKRLKKGLKVLDTEVSPAKAKHKREFSETVVKNLFSNPGTMRLHQVQMTPTRSATLISADECAQLQEQGSWILGTFTALNIRMLDRDHLINFWGSGKHFCPEGDEWDPWIKQRFTHKNTLIWCGNIYESESPSSEGKFSTFFPRTLTEDALLDLIHHALLDPSRLVASQDNRAIVRLGDHPSEFFIELYFSPQHHVIRSAFPLFHFERYDPKKKSLSFLYVMKNSIDPTDPTYEEAYYHDCADLLEMVGELDLDDDEAILYRTETEIFVDIAILTGGDPIKKGVIVAFPISLFEKEKK